MGSPTLAGAHREYTVTASVPPPSRYDAFTEVTFEAVLRTFTDAFVPRVQVGPTLQGAAATVLCGCPVT